MRLSWRESGIVISLRQQGSGFPLSCPWRIAKLPKYGGFAMDKKTGTNRM
jgi:hypothetical protein